MDTRFQDFCDQQVKAIDKEGLLKREVHLTTPQGASIEFAGHSGVLNLCANNYLGLAQHPKVIEAARAALDKWGYGMSSVRFICGTQEIHAQLESALSEFLGMQETILYSSCFDANAGLFETLLGDQDAIISDELNHASIIDGIRLCKARRYRYRNSDMRDLEANLEEADRDGARFKLISTDGVFSMDGQICRLDEICALAGEYNAVVHVDDSHATGIVGDHGRGTHEQLKCMDQVDIITSTLGKALGGGSGGFTASSREIVALLRQRSRPYLFSNTLAPPMVAGALQALSLASDGDELRARLNRYQRVFRDGLTALSYVVLKGSHPIIPVMLMQADKATRLAHDLLAQGVFAVAFSYPVVPRGKARIRTQMSAGFSDEDVRVALDAFQVAGERRE